jgi:hypothetical protein
MNSPWLPFAYQYGIFTIFIIASVAIAVMKKTISVSHPTERRILIEIIAGYLFFIALHASMILFAGAQ